MIIRRPGQNRHDVMSY